MAASPLRTLIESPLFEDQRKRIQPITSVWDEFWFGLDWVLAHDPEAGDQVFGLPYWIFVTEPAPGMPRLRILYEFDDDSVTLLAMGEDEVTSDLASLPF